jgi:hypothetical protein
MDMTIREFLDSLGSSDVQGRLPEDGKFYEDVVRTHYATFDPSWSDDPKLDEKALDAWGRWSDKAQLLVRELRWLLSLDARTFRAMLWIADWTASYPQEPNGGVNCLAGICSLLWRTCPAGYSDEELAALFDRYCENKALSVNAWQCLRSIANRRFDIKSRYPHHPPKYVLGIKDESDE